MIGSSGSNAQIFYEGLDSIIVIFICGYFKPWEILHFEIEGSDGAGAVDKVIKGQERSFASFVFCLQGSLDAVVGRVAKHSFRSG
jgi:hypothetical protein